MWASAPTNLTDKPEFAQIENSETKDFQRNYKPGSCGLPGDNLFSAVDM